MPVNDEGEIAPKAQRDKQLCHDKHWSEQKMARIVDQCRLPPFEHPVPNNLRCDATTIRIAVSDHMPAVVA